MNNDLPAPFLQAWKGFFQNLLRWEDLDRFWEVLRRSEGPWYIYAVGEAPPNEPVDQATLLKFIDEIDTLLHTEHEEEYCGIVYVDSPEAPRLIKIYDPNNLGSVCGGSGTQPPPLPGWVITMIPPVELQSTVVLPGNRRRWWQKIFAS